MSVVFLPELSIDFVPRRAGSSHTNRFIFSHMPSCMKLPCTFHSSCPICVCGQCCYAHGFVSEKAFRKCLAAFVSRSIIQDMHICLFSFVLSIIQKNHICSPERNLSILSILRDECPISSNFYDCLSICCCLSKHRTLPCSKRICFSRVAACFACVRSVPCRYRSA